MNKKKYNIYLFFLIITFSNFCYSQNEKVHSLDPNKSITQYIHKSWTPGSVFLQNSIYSICQTNEGILLVGTSNGIYIFDGVNFSLIDIKYKERGKFIQVYSAIKLKDNSIIIGTNRGVIKLIDYKPYHFIDNTGLSKKEVFSLCEGKDGTVWIGTNRSGIIKYSNGIFSEYLPDNSLRNSVIYCMDVDDNNYLWVGTNGGGLYKIKDNKVERFTKGNGLSNNVIKSILIDQNKVWIGTNGNGIDLLENDKITHLTKKEGLFGEVINYITKDSKNTLWIGTNSGLFRYFNNKFDSYTYSEGLPNDIVNTIYEDNEGNLWVGTRGGYLNLFKNSFITLFTIREGLSGNFIRSIYEGKNGTILIGTNGNGITKLSNKQTNIYDSKQGLSSGIIRSIIEDKNGTLWVGTYGGGLNKLEKNKFIVYNTKNGFLNDIVMSLLQTKDGSIWVGTGDGIVIFNNKHQIVKIIRDKDGLSHPYIRALMERSNGDIWISTSRGIDVYSKGKISTLISPDTLSKKVVLSMYEDNFGNIWIGTYNDGLYRYYNGKFTRFRYEQGLLDEVIYDIFEDRKGILWFTSNFGIFGIRKDKLIAYSNGEIKLLNESDYILINDFLGIECNGGSHPAGCITKNGKIWVPTMIGALYFDPDLLNYYQSPPNSIITGIKSNDEWIDYTKPLNFDSKTGRIEFHYTAINYYSAENISFKYKLEPFDKDWVYAGNRRIAFYTNLPPGEYTFKVIASNGYHIWSNNPTEIFFYKSPAFFQTIWFYLIIIIVLGILIYIFIWWKIKEHQKREKELIKLVNERTQELKQSEEKLRELNRNKDFFFSQISHDLKGLFMTLVGFSDVLVNDLRKLTIDEIYVFSKNINDTIRYLFEFMNNLLDWSRVQLGRAECKPRKLNLYESISKVVHIQHLNADKKNIKFKVNVEKENYIFADENMLNSILNNLVSNAIKFSYNDSPIEISSSKKDNYYEIKIKDSGIGMDENTLKNLFKIENVTSKKGTTGEKGTGLGLILCKDFIIKNKGDIKIESAINKGTTVTLFLPSVDE